MTDLIKINKILSNLDGFRYEKITEDVASD